MKIAQDLGRLIAHHLARLSYGWVTLPIIWVTGNALAQRLLDVVFNVCQHLMGIGTGSHVSCSGEKILTRLIQKKAGLPYTIFDVGANIGDFTELVMMAFKPGDYTIHVFEPASATHAHLCRVIKEQRGVVINRLAVSDASGEMTLYSDDEKSGLASLTQRQTLPSQSFNQRELVSVITLDSYCEIHGIDHIDLLKIDVEGHELAVLRGASSLFERKAIRMVSFEFSGANIDTRTFVFDYYNFFRRYGMALYRLTRSGYLHPLPRYSEKLEQFRTTIYVAVAETP